MSFVSQNCTPTTRSRSALNPAVLPLLHGVYIAYLRSSGFFLTKSIQREKLRGGDGSGTPLVVTATDRLRWWRLRYTHGGDGHGPSQVVTAQVRPWWWRPRTVSGGDEVTRQGDQNPICGIH